MKRSKILHWKSYCSESLELIENYQQALTENFKDWCIHHRLEIKPDGTRVSAKELIDQGLYYGRPAEELIFMRFEEHTSLHHKGDNNYWFGKHNSAEARKKMSEALKGENNPMFGKHHSEETRKKMSEALKGKHNSAEARKKMSEALKGKHNSAEARKKMSEALKGENNPMFGKHHSEETRKKMSEARKGKHWYNNGDTSILAKTCPEGFVPGRIK